MPVLKNNLDIFTNPWTYEFDQENIASRHLPATYDWDKDVEITKNDVIIWEQLYYESGNVGVYVAYKPYAEIYMITYNLFFGTDYEFEIFVGDSAEQDCRNKAASIGIILD